jgi:hypothetical protein
MVDKNFDYPNSTNLLSLKQKLEKIVLASQTFTLSLLINFFFFFSIFFQPLFLDLEEVIYKVLLGF